MRPLHIAFFNRSYWPETAATGQLLTELCESLAREHCCRVTVVAGPAPGGARPRREQHNGVEILRARGTQFSKHHFPGRFANYVSYFLSACWTGQRLARPDVVVALTDPPIIGLAAWLAAQRSGAALVMSYRDIFPEVGALLEDFRSPAVNWMLARVNRFLARRAERVVALGATMRRRLVEGKGADPARTVVIPDWADCEAIRPGPKRNPFSDEHGLADKFVVMHSGNLGLSQNLEVLVEAAERLAAERNIEIVFVGDGVKKPALEKLAHHKRLSNARFLPFTPKERLAESFASVDAFVVSLQPGLAGYIVPSKLYGILAAGRPYVAAVEAESEVTAITRENDCGLLARPGDAADLAEKILALYRDPALRERLGANARRASAAFDRRTQVEAYYKLFRQVADERPARAPWLKRPFDLALSGLGLLASAPLWLLFAAAIKLEDGGPVFYGRERVGWGGRRFKAWKFRSMVADADARFGPRQATADDPRVTRVGRALRATAMDELPQLWNIIRGEMSFVGPRALLPEEIEVAGGGNPVPVSEVPGYRERQRVRPGLTGLSQVYAPRDLPRRHKFRLDRLYIDRQSFLLDLKLIAVSFWITARGKWESPEEKV